MKSNVINILFLINFMSMWTEKQIYICLIGVAARKTVKRRLLYLLNQQFDLFHKITI